MKLNNALKDAGLIAAGILSAALGLKGFLLSSRFIDGGVTGISMLVSDVTAVPLSILLFAFNLPFLFLGYRRMGKTFAIKSILSIAGLSLCLAFIHFPDITPDKLLTAVFGGFFIGVGIGLAIRGGAVLDGTEIAALLLSKRITLFKVSDLILVLNVFIFSLAAFVLDIESALYSILTYLAASKMIDFILNGIEQYTGVTIISAHSDILKPIITNKLGLGITIYQGKLGYGKVGHIDDPRDIIFTIATRLEIPGLKQAVLKVDPAAFIIQQNIDDATGGLVNKKVLH
ncbi:YitT family protein [Mucilaginibacter koreensis]